MDAQLLCLVTSFLAGVLHLLLGVYVLAKGPRSIIARAFLITMIMGFLLGITDALTLVAADASTATLMTRFQVFFFTLMVGGYLFLSSQLPYENFQSRLWTYRSHIIVFVMIFGLGGALFNGTVMEHSIGFEIGGNIGLIYLLIISTTFAAGSVFLLHRTFLSTDNPEARNQCVLLAIGICFPILYYIGLYALEPFSEGALDMDGLAYLVTMIIFAYGILRYKMFIINPVVETSMVMGEPFEHGSPLILDKACLLVEERKPERAYDLLLERLSRGSAGLVISRTYPDEIKERYGLERTPVIWLANQPGQDRVEPGNISIIENMISDFIRKTDGATIMLDGIEFLISENDTADVLKMLYSVADEATIGNAVIIIALNPCVLEPSEIAFFERDFEVVHAKLSYPIGD